MSRRIFVRTILGKSYTLEVTEDMTVSAIKQLILEQYNILCTYIACYRSLEDNDLLPDSVWVFNIGTPD